MDQDWGQVVKNEDIDVHVKIWDNVIESWENVVRSRNNVVIKSRDNVGRSWMKFLMELGIGC